MNAHSFPATAYRSCVAVARREPVIPGRGPWAALVCAGQIDCLTFMRLFPPGSPIPEMEPSCKDAPEALRSNGWRGRVIGPATAKTGSFAITVNGRGTIGVIVAIDLERGAPVRKVMNRGVSPASSSKRYGR